jgi:DNA-directed RNA polymerase specialized sigma24 family protein
LKDENVLIEQLILGKESAFVDLFDDYGVIVYNVALNIMQHKEDAEDLV